MTWFEEPVSSDDLTGFIQVGCLQRRRGRRRVRVHPGYFAAMLEADAVDCLQADATRCGGYTGWLQVAALADAHQLQISAHCAPNLHAPVAASVTNLRHIEYFHDHHRIETTLFDGALSPNGGALVPAPSRPGHGLSFRECDAEPYRIT